MFSFHKVSRKQKKGTHFKSSPSVVEEVCSLEELELVAAVSDETQFRCTHCQKTLSKDSAVRHFTGATHGLSKSQISQWVVVKDACRLRHGHQGGSQLTQALWRGPSAQRATDGEDTGASTFLGGPEFHDTPFVPVATDAASSVTDDALLLKAGPVDEEDNVGTRILQTMAGLNARHDKALAPPAIEVKVPKVVAAARATHWTDHALPKKDAKRHQCPISIYREPRSLADFEGHLRACGLKQVAANDNLAAVRRFLEVISIDDLDELPR